MSSPATALSGAVIAFDLDGTLVDSAGDLVGTLNGLLQAHGHAPLSLAQGRSLIGKGARSLIQRGFQAAGETLDNAGLETQYQRFLVDYLARIADESRPFPGVGPALDRLKGAGAKLVVCTNKRTDLSVALLDALDMSHWFEAVIGSDATPAIKPDPRHLETAVAAAGGQIGRSIMVGDAATDAGAARAAGAALILVSFGYTDTPARELGPDLLIDHFDELADGCERLLSSGG